MQVLNEINATSKNMNRDLCRLLDIFKLLQDPAVNVKFVSGEEYDDNRSYIIGTICIRR